MKNKLLTNKKLFVFIFIAIIELSSFARKNSLDFRVEHHRCQSIYGRLHKWVEIEEQIKFLLNLIPKSEVRFHKQNCHTINQFQVLNIRNQIQKILTLIEYENSLVLPFGSDHKQIVPILKHAKNIMCNAINHCAAVSHNVVNKLLHLTTCLINNNRHPTKILVSGGNCRKIKKIV